jgi:hypothetical protein
MNDHGRETVTGSSEDAQPLCKVRARDGTEREIEILCSNAQAQEVYRDLQERGYLDVEVRDLLGQSHPQERR